MAVLVNYKICDNAAECGGIAACPTGAIFWNETKEKIDIDNHLCISCRKCENECQVGAIRVAENDKEYEKIKEDINTDKRTVEELFVERYGAMPIDDACVLEQYQADELVQNHPLVFLEQFQDSSIQCLLHSIPISVVIEKYGCKYGKQQVDDEVEGSYPRLLIYKDGQLSGQIEGYFEDHETECFFGAIDKYIDG